MALFDDDFYSTKVSRKSRRQAQLPPSYPVPRSFGVRPRRSSMLRIVLVSALTSAVTVFAVLGALMWYHNSYASSASASSLLPLEQTGGNPYEQLTMVAEQVRPAIVSIVNYQNGEKELDTPPALDESALGSGVIFRKEGDKAYIVTNNHVISDADEVKAVLTDGTVLKAAVVGADFITDIAVLSVSAKDIDTVAPIGDSDDLQLGETVLAIGNPLGFNGTMTSGIVSYDNRLIPVSLNQDGNYDWEQNVIQTDAAINEGNSGGALVNLSGQVIGINTMKIADTGVEGLGFAIPINEVMDNAEQLMKSGKISRPYLGVYSIDLDNEYAYRSYDEEESESTKPKLPDGVEEGAVVVEASGPAKQAGLAADDVIVQLDREKISSTLELRKYLYNHKEAGDTLKITYYRSGTKKTVNVTLESQPDNHK
ncbi:S1C family serine protease [Paenibacillus wulumuqiensis]|uniref:S1C family serine protease n=1 Tax=Paenibacillus wulumuqiensis TaxID=1567107 RepID=UPI0006196FB3|nr:trypsin-like peptidase domain-containing protein [Paenibacillus wulumuqiensis]